MRLIDAEALKETIGKYEFNAPNEKYKQGGECVLNFYMPKIIDDAPTVDAAPVRHGKWINKWSDNYDGYCNKCSLCGEYDALSRDDYEFRGGKIRDNNSNYCPNCGAIMDGGISDGINERDNN